MDPNNPPEITPELLEQNPVLAMLLGLFTLLVLVFIVGAITSWIFLGHRLWRKQPILPVEQPWSPRVWGLVDLVVIIILLLASQIVLGMVGVAVLQLDVEALRNGAEPPLSFAAISSAGYLITMALGTGWILARYGVNVSHLGFTDNRFLKHLLVGLVAGFATLPFIYALSAAVSIGFNREYKHPLLEAMQQEGSLSAYLLAVFAAVLVAPLAEEFLFRVIIQGWLQSIPFSSPGAMLMGASESRRNDPADAIFFHRRSLASQAAHVDYEDLATESSDEGLQVQTEVSAERTHGSRESQDIEMPYVEIPARGVVRPPFWPAIVTGILFGLAHWGYGLSFIPLIALGIVLGALYRATNSIWPCVVVHLMLNASSMLALGVSVLLQQAVE